MRTVLSSSVLALGMFSTTGSLPAAAASVAQAERTQVVVVRSVERRGGSLGVAGNPRSAQAESCRSAEFRGESGVISVQTSPNGTVAWGISMYDPALNSGL